MGEMPGAVWIKMCIPLMVASMLVVADWGILAYSVAIRLGEGTLLSNQTFALLSNMMAH